MSITRYLTSIGLIGLSMSVAAKRPAVDDEALKAANGRAGVDHPRCGLLVD